MKKFLWFFTGVLLLCACGRQEKVYRIGVDPSFSPLDLKGQQIYLSGFLEELLLEISMEAKIKFSRVWAMPGTLQKGLEEHQFDGVFASYAPYNFLREKFVFSPVFFETGPVLVVKANAPTTDLAKMDGKLIALQTGDQSISVVQRYPKVMTTTYLLIPRALNELDEGKVDGVVIDVFLARQYMRDLYAGKFKMGAPLKEEGLRLITLKKEEDSLMRIFNRSMKNLKKNGKLAMLEKKWNLSDP